MHDQTCLLPREIGFDDNLNIRATGIDETHDLTTPPLPFRRWRGNFLTREIDARGLDQSPFPLLPRAAPSRAFMGT